MPALARVYLDVFPSDGIEVSAFAKMSTYVPPGLYFNQIAGTFRFLKSTRLRIFVAVGTDQDLPDIMLAANATDLLGCDNDPSMPDYPQYFFFDNGFADITSATFSIVNGYDGVWTAVRAWDAVINNASTTSAARINDNLGRWITFNDILNASRYPDISFG
eukprot:jgi/Hompol1/2607/HPOL_006078-RA